jgi:DNA replication and repair protein RecF
VGRIEHDDEEHGVAVAYQRGGRKRITIDEVPVRAADLYERYLAVSAGPEDTEILAGAPSARRTFIDMYLSQFSRNYISLLIDYQRTLAQKNAALRNGTTPDPFNALLVPLGAKITATRMRFLGALAPSSAEHYRQIAAGGAFSLRYKASAAPEIEGADEAQVSEQFERKLGSYAERERIMQTSLVGPHRDDILFEIGDYPARTHASQGELRTGAIALKLGVYELLAQQRGTVPLLLLDEIFAELDPKRTAGLVESFAGFRQLFLTTASEPPASLRGQTGRRFEISRGSVTGIA